MRSMKSRLILVITVLMLVSLACKAFSGEQDVPTEESTEAVSTTPAPEGKTATLIPTEQPPAATEAPAATQTSQPTAAALPPLPPAEPGPDTLDLDGLPEDHGQSDFTENIFVNISWMDDDGVEQEAPTLYSHRQQSLPAFAWNTLFDDQNIFFPTSIETTLVNEQAFSTSSDDEGCISLEADLVNLDEQRQSFRDLIGALTGQVSKTETDMELGDLIVDVYTLEAANFTPGAEVEIKGVYLDSEGGNFTTSSTLPLNEEDHMLESGRLFLAQQGGFVARIEMLYAKIAEEEDAIFAQPGTRMERTMVYEVLPATVLGDAILPPEGCEASTDDGGIEDGDQTGSGGNLTIAVIPRIGEPTNVVESGESLIYNTDYSVDEVVDFYKSELGALGWEVDDEFTMDGLATLVFINGDQTIYISIIDSGDGVLVSVDIY